MRERLGTMDEKEALGVAIYAVGCLVEPDPDPPAAVTMRAEEALRVLTGMLNG